MPRRTVFPALLVIAGLLLPIVGSAQRADRTTPSLAPHKSVVRSSILAPTPPGTQPLPSPLQSQAGAPTNWLEGGMIGALLGGAIGYLGATVVANGICTGSDAGMCNDYNVRIGIGGAVVGFLIGASIGSHHPKENSTEPHSTN